MPRRLRHGGHFAMVALLSCLMGLTTAPIPAAPPQPHTPQSTLLYSLGTPDAIGLETDDHPTLTFYHPDQNHSAQTAVVICPGGGYRGLAIDHEGRQVAEWMNSMGVTAAVLTYRRSPRYRHPAPMLDVQRAIRKTRFLAERYGYAADRVGVLGFSAGGHLASTAATHFDAGNSAAADPIDRLSCRPDFAVLCYPVISFVDESCVHAGSRKNLLGENPDPDLVRLMSNELQVTHQTPPTFLFHTAEDAGVRPKNSLLFFDALQVHGVPAELHVYAVGKHGLGLAPDTPGTSDWPSRCEAWLELRGLLTPPVPANEEDSASTSAPAQ